MSNYPAGVTGNEYAIAGGTPVRGTVTRNVTHECPEPLFDSEWEGDVEVDDVEYHAGIYTGFFECPACGQQDVATWDAEDPRWED